MIIDRFHSNYFVPKANANPFALKKRFNKIAANLLGQEIEPLLAHIPLNPSTLVFIKKLSIHLVLNPAKTDDRTAARLWAQRLIATVNKIAQTMPVYPAAAGAAGKETGSNVALFQNQAAYLAHFIHDLTGTPGPPGEALNKWYYYQFRDLSSFSPAHIVKAVCKQNRHIIEAVFSLLEQMGCTEEILMAVESAADRKCRIHRQCHKVTPRDTACRRSETRTGREDGEFDASLLEKIVYLQRAIHVGRSYAGQNVELHLVLQQHVHPAHYGVERALARGIEAMGVVDFLGPVEAQAHQPVALRQEAAPLVVQQRAIGLQRVTDPHIAGLHSLEFDGPAVEVQPHQCRLAPLPTELDRPGGRLGGDVLANVGLEHLIRHASRLAVVEQRLLLQIEAVVAPQIAGRADGLGHDGEANGLFQRLPA